MTKDNQDKSALLFGFKQATQVEPDEKHSLILKHLQDALEHTKRKPGKNHSDSSHQNHSDTHFQHSQANKPRY